MSTFPLVKPKVCQIPKTYPQNSSCENTLGKGDIASNFSLPLSVIYPFGEVSANIIKFEIVVCKLFQFGRV